MSRHTPEGKFKQSVVDELNTWILQGKPVWYYLTHDDQGGIPDVVGVCEGRFFGLELKSSTKALSTQALTLIKIGAAGGIGVVVDDKDTKVCITVPLEGTSYFLPKKTWLYVLLLHAYPSPKE